MNLLLTHGYFLCDDIKEQKIMRPYPPLGILYISGWLDGLGISHEVFDTTFSTKEKFQGYLLAHQPRIVALYVNLMTKLNVLETILFIKRQLPASCIVLGGPEVRYSAENFLRYGADYIVIGEGEESMAELVSLPNQLLTEKKADHICGIAFLKNDCLIQTQEREKIKDLDTLPTPNRGRINLDLYLQAWKNHHGKNAISVSTMRGCPYTCKWCSRAVYGLSYRRRSPVKVVEELEEIKKNYNPDSLWFVDDVFTISHKWLTGFRDELKRKDLIIPYECITRADRMNEEVIKLLKETGCFRVWIGAESGSQKVIDLMDRRVNVDQVREMIHLTKKHGIETGTFIMLGYPGETEEDIEETILHLKKSNPDHFTITVAYPIRGTELYEEVEALQTQQLDWSQSTDREIDFTRKYSPLYYRFALLRVINEVQTSRELANHNFLKGLEHKSKSLFAKAAMVSLRHLQKS
jgi:anaerobic magnesium-protoporphyrin IX monomethyl ester cyclase